MNWRRLNTQEYVIGLLATYSFLATCLWIGLAVALLRCYP
jgi:hypothetical protein